jgi:hypothetical protein
VAGITLKCQSTSHVFKEIDMKPAPSHTRWALILAIACFASALLGSAVSHARVIGPGENNDALVDPFKGVSLADRPDLIGDVIADLTVPFDNGQTLIGTIRTQVVREDVAGTLDFYYQLSLGLDQFSVSGFKGFLVDADFRTDLGHGAAGLARSADGDTLNFVFVSSQGPTFIKTDATDFALRGEFVATPDNGDPERAVATVYAPAAAPATIPLPPAVLAAPLGLLIAGYVTWRTSHPRHRR